MRSGRIRPHRARPPAGMPRACCRAVLQEVLMTHRYIKMGITAATVVTAFVALLWTTLRDGTEYFKNIDEVMVERQAWEGKPLQLHGYIVPGSILRRPGSLDYRFKVQNNPPHSSGSGPVVEAS